MSRQNHRREFPIRKLLIYPLIGGIAVWFFAHMVSFPTEALAGALKGFSIWWDVLFPALFPFLVISEVMLGFGIVHFIGTILDPMMRPLFRVPGIGGFVMAMGFASGYPVGAKLTVQLREQQLVRREEGERLVAFTTTSDPIFLIGAVSIGFYQHASLALLLAAAHYGAAVLLGLLMRFYKPNASASMPEQHHKGSAFKRAFHSMHHARLLDARSLGQLLQDAVKSSLNLMFVIGGLVVFFSVFMEMMRVAGLLDYLYNAASTLLDLIAIPAPFAEAVTSGLFEVTLGAQAAGASSMASGMLLPSAAVGSLVLAWGGLICACSNLEYYE